MSAVCRAKGSAGRHARLWIAALAFAPAAAAQDVLIPPQIRAAAERITVEQITRDVEYLASDELRGRDTPSPGLDSAAAYIVRRLQRAGLTPLGDNGSFYQSYTISELIPDTLNAYIESGGRRHRFGNGFVFFGFARPVQVVDAAVLYAGRGGGADTLDVRDKVVLLHAPVPRAVFASLARRGAAAAFVIPTQRVLDRWEDFRTDVRRFELEPWVLSAYADAPLNIVYPEPAVTDLLLTGESISREQLLALPATTAEPAAFELRARITLHLPASVSTLHRAYNIVALLEGRDQELNEYVTVASHLDGAVDTIVVDGDSIYNAADDNASGSAATLAIAEQLAMAPRPRRSIVFIWDSGEEIGLLGTRRFVSDPPVPLDHVVAHFNVDMIGSTRGPADTVAESGYVTGTNEVYVVGPGVLSAALDSILQRVNREYLNLTYNRALDADTNQFFYPRTDGAPFLERGVVMVEYFTGIHDRYHMPADEIHHLDYGKITAIARTILATLWVVAEHPERPTADKGWPARVPRY